MMMQQRRGHSSSSNGIDPYSNSVLPLTSTSGSKSSKNSSSPQRKRRVTKRAFRAYTNGGALFGGSGGFLTSPTAILLFGCVGGILLFATAVYLGILLANARSSRGQHMYKGGRGQGKGGTIQLNPNNFMEMMDDTVFLPFNSKYRAPESIPTVGDRSDRYADLRKRIDPMLPEDTSRSLGRVSQLQKLSLSALPMDVHNSDQVLYDSTFSTRILLLVCLGHAWHSDVYNAASTHLLFPFAFYPTTPHLK